MALGFPSRSYRSSVSLRFTDFKILMFDDGGLAFVDTRGYPEIVDVDDFGEIVAFMNDVDASLIGPDGDLYRRELERSLRALGYIR